jgi:hypothetical protein
MPPSIAIVFNSSGKQRLGHTNHNFLFGKW